MKGWTRPQLIVLGKATPEESVLVVCKNHETHDFGPGMADCSWRSNATNECRGVSLS